MKKIIFNNGSNLELAYQETKVKFGNEEFATTRHLVLSVLDKDGDKYTPKFEIMVRNLKKVTRQLNRNPHLCEIMNKK